MQQDIVTVGVDLAKNVFQVHAIGADGKVLVRRRIRRGEVLKFFSSLPPCLIGMEACASAHHWGLICPRFTGRVQAVAETNARCSRGERILSPEWGWLSL